KRIMPCRYGSVRREDAGCANLFGRFFKRLPLLNEFPGAFEQHERRVAFVRMKNNGLNAQRAKYTNAADAQNNLLTNPMLFIATIQSGRKFSVALLIFFDVGVHEI